MAGPQPSFDEAVFVYQRGDPFAGEHFALLALALASARSAAAADLLCVVPGLIDRAAPVLLSAFEGFVALQPALEYRQRLLLFASVSQRPNDGMDQAP